MQKNSLPRYLGRARLDLLQIIHCGRGDQWPDPVAYVRALRDRIAVFSAHRESGRAGRAEGTRFHGIAQQF